ncbi:MAG: DegT/DnrJ/EryC1/StrS family aminotransferase, partial [Bacteroidia bacterium]|nr:DegT/DnrJ/EryC1/StrS family aminotransferase [Bacteroidia bacterium]
DIRTHFESKNIECRPLWKPMHQQPVFKDAPKYLNGVSDRLFEKGLCLPSGSNLTEDELDRVVQTFKSYFI